MGEKMYEAYYGLNQNPFSLTPDPHFLYWSKNHRETMESILYGIHRREGFIVVTGEIGTGKTTLCRALLERLPSPFKTAVVFNSFVTEAGLLSSILEDFGAPVKGRTKKDRVDALNLFLLDLLSRGGNAVLIIDEAQNLSVPVMEQIRMLSNLETEKEKMLQIVLVGQLELEKKLRSSKLKQLNQRIAIRCRLLPLTRQEMEAYIMRRLVQAGNQRNVTFSRTALDEIYRRSQGIPRLINLLCDRALLAGFVKQMHRIDRALVRKASKSLLGMDEKVSLLSFLRWPRRILPWAISTLFVLFLLWSGTIQGKQKDPFHFQKMVKNIESTIRSAEGFPAITTCDEESGNGLQKPSQTSDPGRIRSGVDQK
jgi:general secretion pathway protein A